MSALDIRTCMLLMVSEMEAEAAVMPPAVAMPSPMAEMMMDTPNVTGISASPVMTAAPPTAVVVPPVMFAILARWWKLLRSSAMPYKISTCW